MNRGPSDEARAVEFDLPRGVVQAGGQRMLLVPATLFADVARDAGALAAMAAARCMGAAAGARVAVKLGGVDAVRRASIEQVISALAAELSLAGLGTARLERWGRALVIALEGCPIVEPSSVAAVVEGAVAASSGRAVAATMLLREDDVARVLVSGRSAVERVAGWMASGKSWGEALATLQSGAGA